MTNEQNVEITPAGLKQLDAVLAAQRTKIIEEAKDQKFIPGERIIELTASDIENVSSRIIFLPRKQSILKAFLIPAYAGFGALLAGIGTVLPWIEEVILNEPERAAFIASGLIMAFAGAGAAFYADLKSRRARELAEKYSLYHSELLKESFEQKLIIEEEVRKTLARLKQHPELN